MRRLFPLLFILAAPGALASSPLLTAKPPCPAPADLPASEGVEYRAGAERHVPPANLNGPPPALNMEIPLGVPVTEFTDQPTDLSLSQVPVGTVRLQEGKAELEVLGQPATPPPDQTSDCAPAPQP